MKSAKKSSAKKSPAKKPAAKKAIKKPAAKKAPVAKKPIKKVVAKKPAKKVVKKVAPKKKGVSPEQRYTMVQEAAYFIAERHGFCGDSSHFWWLAEMEVSKQF